MQLDFSELEKGLQEGLAKVADTAEPTPGNSFASRYPIVSAGARLLEMPMAGLAHVNAAVPKLINSLATDAADRARGGAGTLGGVVGGVNSLAKITNNAFDMAARPAPVAQPVSTAPVAQPPKPGLVNRVLAAGAKFTGDIAHRPQGQSMIEASGNSLLGMAPQLVQDGYNKANDVIKGTLGEGGKFVLPALGAVGALGLGSMLFGKKKERGSGGRSHVTVNVNGGGPQRPGFFNQTGINSLSNPNFGDGHEKSADVVTSALANAMKNRLANKVLDAAAPHAQHQPAQEKALEISSKYPEMAKLLKDEKNKEYLAHLLQA